MSIVNIISNIVKYHDYNKKIFLKRIKLRVFESKCSKNEVLDLYNK